MDTLQVVGRFKAVIEVEIKTEKHAYKHRKMQLVNELLKNLKELAHYRQIDDFNLDLELLDTVEGRVEIKDQIAPLGVGHLNIV